ncbi:cell wall surface anchor family protein [Pseudoscardovia radai]|uniref:Cell wall surface anchor family protein n=1 Tax=Pseudoscardovia radai TaxID=987066 RepID=A0A261EQ95_9BIFI|nr:hypothetical protein [Pseudoscardovia radai]OZG49021.1 cell wall surface anchor family protein [Pseudoscardovia radai]
MSQNDNADPYTNGAGTEAAGGSGSARPRHAAPSPEETMRFDPLAEQNAAVAQPYASPASQGSAPYDAHFDAPAHDASAYDVSAYDAPAYDAPAAAPRHAPADQSWAVPSQPTQALPTQPMQSRTVPPTRPLPQGQPTVAYTERIAPLPERSDDGTEYTSADAFDLESARRYATETMAFADRPSVLPSSQASASRVPASRVPSSQIPGAGSVPPSEAETQILDPLSVNGAAYGAPGGSRVNPAYVAAAASAMPPTAAMPQVSVARTPRSAQSQRVTSSQTPQYAGGAADASLATSYPTEAYGSVLPAGYADSDDDDDAISAAANAASNASDGSFGSVDASANDGDDGEGNGSKKHSAGKVIAIVAAIALIGVGVGYGLSRMRSDGASSGESSSSNSGSAFTDCQNSMTAYNNSRDRWNSVVSSAASASSVTADQVQDASTVDNLKQALAATVPGLTQCDASMSDDQLKQVTDLNNTASDTLQANADTVTSAAQKVTDSKSAKDSADAAAQQQAQQQQQQQEAAALAAAQASLKSQIAAANAQLATATSALGANDADVAKLQQQVAESQKLLDDGSADTSSLTDHATQLQNQAAVVQKKVQEASAAKPTAEPSASASATTEPSAEPSASE